MLVLTLIIDHTLGADSSRHDIQLRHLLSCLGTLAIDVIEQRLYFVSRSCECCLEKLLVRQLC
jgi:hypothetical protein